ncbi:hypothetical protein NUU61_003578 [Penicillium alfredii]|uniref:Uncharacterized protein n=1 Tax=Penicillium alfredii TaxID=1506179 RepID=A0A9W9KD22_9EURO|nr:uncharacterized protein NUU61_003578 [Penicillium alfredii]KAJ5101356.1 hypothetical protein NUU61_003578 [Penicillium alfredii]
MSSFIAIEKPSHQALSDAVFGSSFQRSVNVSRDHPSPNPSPVTAGSDGAVGSSNAMGTRAVNSNR